VADGWCWFVLREEYCWLVAGGWFVVREKAKRTGCGPHGHGGDPISGVGANNEPLAGRVRLGRR
jgi:hypothetical protein